MTLVDADFQLSEINPSDTPDTEGGKRWGSHELNAGTAELQDLQSKLYAESLFGGTRSILLVLQAMDTAGKGGIVSHVMRAMDPQGVTTFGFKAPTDEEKQHDFLWRIRPHLPKPGMVGVFDRSHYEDVLIHRVRGFSSPEAIEERYGLINAFESELVASGTTVIKVMLHISKREQKRRLLARLDDPTKQWKFSPGDIDERGKWDAYQEAYQIALTRTSTPDAPWHVIPANHKWYARLAVQRLLLDALRDLDPHWPAPTYDVEEQKARLTSGH